MSVEPMERHVGERAKPGGGERVAVLMSPSLVDRLFSNEDQARLRALGAGLTPTSDSSEPGSGLGVETEVIVTGWDSPALTEDVLDRIPNLRLIAHTGASIRGIVPPSVYDRGIAVTTVAGVLAEGVAEFALMAIIAGLRRAVGFHEQMRQGAPWERLAEQAPGRLLHGSTVGVVGASRVGRALIRLLHAFDCRVLVYDPYLAPGAAEDLRVVAVALERLLAASDVVTLHAPDLPATRGMIGRDELGLMRSGALLVNTARAGLVDELALLTELQSGRLTAAIDVFHEEPLPRDSPWRGLPGVLVTPHIAALTRETLLAQGGGVVDEIVRAGQGKPLVGEVSRELYDRMG